MNIFLIILLICCICLWLRLYAVDFFDNLTYGCVDGLVVKNFLGRVHEENVHPILAGEHVLLLSECLSDTSFAEIALDRSLEDLFRYGYKNPGMLTSRVLSHEVTHTRNISVSALCKKLSDERLAAESFALLKRI